MLAQARLLLSSGLARIKQSKLGLRNMSDKSKDQALKFEIGGKKETFKVIDEAVESKKVYGFFSTLKGQKIVGSIWVVGSALGTLWHVAPHWLFLNQVKGIYQSYSKGFPTLVQKEMVDVINEVAVEMKLEEAEINSMNLFVLTMTEPFAWGELGKDALIGYPEYYYWTNINDVPIGKMRFGAILDTGVDNCLSPEQLEGESAGDFCSSMILSKDAKKFSIAREIERTKIQPYMTNGVFSFCFILLTYNFARIINKKMNMFKRPPLLRGIGYLSLLPTMVLSYTISKDTFSRYVDRELTRKAAGVSPEYAKGGLEYYHKVLQRNIALRELEGDGGRSRYTSKGEVIQGIIRVKQASIQERKDICENLGYIRVN